MLSQGDACAPMPIGAEAQGDWIINHVKVVSSLLKREPYT